MFEINSIWLSFIIQIAIYDPLGELNFSLVQLSLTWKTVYYGDNPSRAVFCRWLFASIEMFSFSLFFDKSGKTTFNFWHSTCSNTGWRKWWRPSHLFIEFEKWLIYSWKQICLSQEAQKFPKSVYNKSLPISV